MVRLYHKNLALERVKRQIIKDNFDGGRLSSDGGMLLLKQVAKHLGLSKAVSDIFTDKRDQNKDLQIAKLSVLLKHY